MCVSVLASPIRRGYMQYVGYLQAPGGTNFRKLASSNGECWIQDESKDEEGGEYDVICDSVLANFCDGPHVLVVSRPARANP